MSPNLKSLCACVTLAVLMTAFFSLAPDPPFPGGVQFALASTKLSQISNGGLVSSATDQMVGVRSGTTDQLISVGSLAGENLTTVIKDNGSGGVTIGAAQVANSMLVNAAATVNGQTCTLGASCSGNATITLTGDTTGSGSTAITTTTTQLHGNTLTNGDWCTTNGTIINCATAVPVTSIATNNGLTGGTIISTGTIGLATISNNNALCNNSGGAAVPTSANCTITGTGNLPLASGALMQNLSLTSNAAGIALYLQSGAGQTGLFSAGNSGVSLALQADNGNMQTVAITGAVTLSLTSPTHPTKTNYIIKQDASGHVYSIGGCKWAGGSTIAYSSTANKIDEVSVMYDGSNFYCMGGAAFQ